MDVITKGQRKKVVKKSESAFNQYGIESPYLEQHNRVKLFDVFFKLTYTQRNYLGNIASEFECIFVDAEKVHNNLLKKGVKTIGSLGWEIEYEYSYHELIKRISRFLPKLEKFAVKKTRSSGINKAVSDFFVNIALKILDCEAYKRHPYIRNICRDLFICFAIKSIDFNGDSEPIYVGDILDSFDIKPVLVHSKPLNEFLSSGESLLSDKERRRIIDDIYIIREYLFKGWDFSKHRVECDGYIVELDIAANTPQFAIYPKSSVSNDYQCHDFIKIEQCTYTASLGFNPYLFYNVKADKILSICHEYLLEIFLKTKLDFSSKSDDVENEVNPSSLYMLTNCLVIDYISHEPSNVRCNNARLLSGVMYSKFKSLMENSFSCQFSKGKGSEVKIQMANSKIYTLGHHKKDFELSPVKVKNILRRIGIAVDQFVLAVNSKY
ncbi:hypothetical protein [Photobacterium kasasachensis]|uniref:hypothetical protein n=1 Tax=Photobacterium kasasachensis TaxID=2910240 RepID=UPI003D0EC52A